MGKHANDASQSGSSQILDCDSARLVFKTGNPVYTCNSCRHRPPPGEMSFWSPVSAFSFNSEPQAQPKPGNDAYGFAVKRFKRQSHCHQGFPNQICPVTVFSAILLGAQMDARFQFVEQMSRLPTERKLGKKGDFQPVGSGMKIDLDEATYLSDSVADKMSGV